MPSKSSGTVKPRVILISGRRICNSAVANTSSAWNLPAWVKPFAGIFMDLIPLLYFQIHLGFVWYQYSTIPPGGQQKGTAAPPFLLCGTIWNALRCASTGSGVVDAVCLYDPSRENGIAERPQTLRYPEIKIIFPLNMARAKRKPFSTVLQQKGCCTAVCAAAYNSFAYSAE